MIHAVEIEDESEDRCQTAKGTEETSDISQVVEDVIDGTRYEQSITLELEHY